MSETLPREQLLLKLLKKTQADHDGETLIAIRMANKLLTDAGWDWEKLLSGKITVVEDPFKSIGVPTSGGGTRTQAPAPPPRPDYGARPTPNYAAQSAPQPPTAIIGVSVNRFPGFCWACAKEVLAGNGLIFKPKTHNTHGTDQWKIVCDVCDGKAICQAGPALATRKPGTRRQRSVGDLA